MIRLKNQVFMDFYLDRLGGHLWATNCLMFYKALEIVRKHLDAFIKGASGVPQNFVVLGNIAFSTQDNTATPNVDESAQVYMSLVNVEQESTLRTLPAVRQNDIRPTLVNPPIFVNLYILFSANHKIYDEALKNLSKVVEFFQGNNTFTFAQTPIDLTGDFAGMTEEKKNSFRISLDLMSLTFEQINHLWGSLGGKQVPFVLYKARLVEIDQSKIKEIGTPIQEIQIN